MSALDKDLGRLYSYAMLLADEDTRNARHEGMKQEIVQAQFAEFELRMHEMAAKGGAITGEALSSLHMQITKRYYGRRLQVPHRSLERRGRGHDER
jgi:oligoendopeptidase F